VAPSILTVIDCERVAAGVLPVKAMDIPADYISEVFLKMLGERDAPSKVTSNEPNVVVLANSGYVDVPPYQGGCSLTVQF
jgi:hypothetical protein